MAEAPRPPIEEVKRSETQSPDALHTSLLPEAHEPPIKELEDIQDASGSESQSPVDASQASLLPEARQPPREAVTDIQHASGSHTQLQGDASHTSLLPEAPEQPREEVIDIQGENERFTITGKLIIRRRRPLQQITSETSSGQQPINKGRFVR